jgi:hypothetical protein
MQHFVRVGCLIIATAVPGSCISCMMFKATTRVGSPLDLGKLKEVQAGVTDLRDILEWFGPPDHIIDGTQEIIDEQGGATPGLQFATRTLSAPEGAVILLYSNLRREDSVVHASTPAGVAGKHQYAARANEMMIFVRKGDHKVLSAFAGGEADEAR